MTDRDQSDLFGPKEWLRPGDAAPVIVVGETGTDTKVVHMHWGLRPPPGGKPWHNVRAEGKRFERRCLVPAQEYLIRTREGPNRGKWLVTWPDDPDMCFAGTWRPELADWPASYAIVTCEAGPDLAPYEERQSVFLPPPTWGEWLSGRAREEDVLKALPAGSLVVAPLRRR
jgi:putative SOS response-associated peptidase YedK